MRNRDKHGSADRSLFMSPAIVQCEGRPRRPYADCITACRMILSLSLIFMDAFTLPFYTIYVIAGLTDVVDGYVARRSHSASRFGARLDSIADILLAAVCLFKILPLVNLPIWLIVWICIIVFIRAANVISGYWMFNRVIFLHTRANRITGLLLFILMFFLDTQWMEPSAAMVCIVATYAAAQEGHFIRTERWESEC